MANANPHQARTAKKRIAVQRAGSPDDLRTVVWEAISAAVALVRDQDVTADVRLRAVHAITQAAGAYTKLVELTEFDARLRAVEDAQANEGVTP